MLTKNAILLTVTALAGCAVPAVESTHAPGGAAPVHGAIDPSAVDPSAIDHIDENLARLRALDVFEVGEMIIDMPAEAFNCYGPCPGSEPAIAAAKARSATRLAALADAAEKAAARSQCYVDDCAQVAVDDHVAALNALRIVDVPGLIVAEPQNNPQCYNSPCQADIDAAKATTCARAARLAGIVVATEDL